MQPGSIVLTHREIVCFTFSQELEGPFFQVLTSYLLIGGAAASFVLFWLAGESKRSTPPKCLPNAHPPPLLSDFFHPLTPACRIIRAIVLRACARARACASPPRYIASTARNGLLSVSIRDHCGLPTARVSRARVCSFLPVTHSRTITGARPMRMSECVPCRAVLCLCVCVVRACARAFV